MAKLASRKCCECGRLLTDPESIKRGYGPDCAAKVATNIAAIGAIYGVTPQQWTQIETENPKMSRRIYLAHKGGRKTAGHVQVFLKVALGDSWTMPEAA